MRVVSGALERIAKHGIGFRGFLEFLFRLAAASITVRMTLERQLVVSALQTVPPQFEMEKAFLR